MTKNYYKLFSDYCRENGLGFYFNEKGYVQIATTLDSTGFLNSRLSDYKFGTKAAYDWLVKEHKNRI